MSSNDLRTKGTEALRKRIMRFKKARGGVHLLWGTAAAAAFFAMVMYLRVTQLYPLGGDDQINNLQTYYRASHSSFWETVLFNLRTIWSAFRLKNGRFFPFVFTPYWLWSQVNENIVTYRLYITLVTCITALALALLLCRMTGSKPFAMACFCLAPLMLNLIGNVGLNGLYSYAALPQRTLLVFLMAAHCEVSWARSRRWYWALPAGVFMFVSCGTYEIGYMYGFIGGFIALMLHDKVKDSMRTCLPLICGEGLSLAFYVLTVRLHGAAGSTGINLDVSAILSTWVKQMSGGFPLNNALLAGLKARSLTPDDLIWPLLLASAAVACLWFGGIRLTQKQMLCFLGSGIVMLAGPAFLLSLSAKYQSSGWISWTCAYISQVVEAFGVCILFLLLVLALMQLVRRYVHSKAGQGLLCLLLCMGLTAGSAWMHSIVRTSAPVDAVAGYELYGKALESGLADVIGSSDKVVSTYVIWGGDTDAEKAMYLRYAGKVVDAQTVDTWKAEGGSMPVGTLYLSGLCPGYNDRGAFFLAQVQDREIEHIGRITLFVDGRTVPDEAYVHYRRELPNGIDEVYISLSALPHTAKDDDGCYFAYITDTGILKDSLTLQTQKEAIEHLLDGGAADEKGGRAAQLLDGRFQWRSKDAVVEGRDLAVGNAAKGQSVSFPFTIKKDTVYKVEITLGENTDFAQAAQAVLIVDFYAPNGYDRGEQEAAGFAVNGKYEYTYYFNSGSVGGETLDGWVRMFTANVPDVPIPVDTLRVTEMERAAG